MNSSEAFAFPRLCSVRLSSYRNHARLETAISDCTILCWPNGSGKSAILEALFCLLNGRLPQDRRIAEAVRDGEEASVLSCRIERDAGLAELFGIHIDTSKSALGFSRAGERTTRTGYMRALGMRAIMFHPIEMNLLYLAPALRREFLDETAALADADFVRVRREYQKALVARNRMLKSIREGSAGIPDLAVWDELFIDRLAAYMRVRMDICDRITAFFAEGVGESLEHYRLTYRYHSKIERNATIQDLHAMLSAIRDREIAAGHTLSGPHTDDFSFEISMWEGARDATAYLSRGEMKHLVLALKAFQVRHIRACLDVAVVLLFDDFFSEFDDAHARTVLDRFSWYQLVLSSQRDISAVREHFEGVSCVDITDITNT